MNETNEILINVEDLHKVFVTEEVETHALSGVHLKIKKGEYIAIAGPSGCGKSTLLSILGLLDSPTEGSYRLNNTSVEDLSASQRARIRNREVGFIFQSYNLIPVLTAMENAEYILMLQGVPTAQRRERVGALLKEVGLEGMENRFPRELSGGQQQRVAIARAIASEPALVLADEPTANVDSKTAAGLLDLMNNLNTSKGVTFFFSTHDKAVMRRARHLLWLKDGRIAYDGEPIEDLDVD